MISVVRRVAVFALLAGCGGPNPIGPLPTCDSLDQPSCASTCCTDFINGTSSCVEGRWVCDPPFIDLATCTDSCRPPPSSKTVCVDRDAGVCLGCPGGETCLTTFSCTGSDGGTSCVDLADAGYVGDDRCHGSCNSFEQCAAGETCRRETFSTGCSADGVASYVCF